MSHPARAGLLSSWGKKMFKPKVNPVVVEMTYKKYFCRRCGIEKWVGPFGSACPFCPEDAHYRENCGICGVPRWRCCC